MDFVFREVRGELRELLRKHEPTTPWQPIPVALAAVVAPLVFCWTYFWCCCSSLRYHMPAVVVVLVLPMFGLAAGVSAKVRTSLRDGTAVRGPIVVAVGCWVAVLLALFLGERNYRWHMVSYYSYQDLAAYTNIDPSDDRGQTYMDAGQVYFNEASYVAADEFVDYRSGATYCVAPIMSQDALSNSIESAKELKQTFPHFVDFWAVGMNCCDQATGTFTCGEVADKSARSGLRLLRDDVRPFYALAVQEWEAKWCPDNDNTAAGHAQAQPLACPRAGHPLFFHWVVDPLLAVDNFYEESKSLFGLQTVLFVVCNFVVALFLFWFLFNLGFK